MQADVITQPVVFNNSYTAQSAKVSLTAQKTLTGRSLKDREFSFELYNEAGDLVATGYNDTNGLVTFPEFTIDTVGPHTFKIKEVKENLGGVTYDQTEQTVTVDVVDNQQGQLVATITSATPNFTNKYEASPVKVTLSARKALDGRDLQANEFEFVLTDQDGQEVGRATNEANGDITFAELTFNKADTYTYTISEVMATWAV
ncbi:Spy0128 family protein [Streptococcus sp.]|uniref:Spy0128 family protein n=1 Tax=Streptococcus sp. TaxID=1306 RepID=UPI00391AF128